MNTIFIITAVTLKKEDIRHRAWAWYETLDKAKKSLKNNTDYFCESGSFNYVVIEEVCTGMVVESWWFEIKHDYDSKKYEINECKKPDKVRQIVSWGLG